MKDNYYSSEIQEDGTEVQWCEVYFDMYHEVWFGLPSYLILNEGSAHILPKLGWEKVMIDYEDNGNEIHIYKREVKNEDTSRS